MHKIKLFLILNFFLFSSLHADENTSITISNAWINEAPPTVSILAAYATIENTSDKTHTLISVTSSFFSKIELHLSKVVDEMATMEKQESLVIPAKDAVELSPGAYHLMLFDPETPLKAGDNVTLTFNFADGASNNVEASVKRQNHDEQSHHHEHHH